MQAQLTRKDFIRALDAEGKIIIIVLLCFLCYSFSRRVFHKVKSRSAHMKSHIIKQQTYVEIKK